MSIVYNSQNKVFTLNTKNSSYQMQIGRYGHLFHLYYGKSLLDGETAEHAITVACAAYTPYAHDSQEERVQPNIAPQEFSCYGVGDYKSDCIHAVFADGSQSIDLRYESHRIFDGKPTLNGLPATYFGTTEAESLEIILKDTVTDLRVALLYTIADGYDAVMRSAKIINDTDSSIYLESALTGCLDIQDNGYELIRFMGRATMERMIERDPLKEGRLTVESTQGVSSHSANPFVVLCEPHTNEYSGDCYGISLVYSGNFAITADVSPMDHTRIAVGINPKGFRFMVEAGDSFQTPEMVMVYSDEGFNKMSQCYHAMYREHLCRGYYKDHRRPILINSWEALIFDFDSDKIVDLAKSSAECGIELLVLDDGWFGVRNDDSSSLGDWYANEEKLNGTLAQLVDRVNAEGLKFGLWFEPEMISENSDLYRAHPDWCLRCPDRSPALGRGQLVLDMSRQEVVNYLDETISKVLSSANIEYVKWDMNRPLTDVYSKALPAERQGEVFHRYMLGVYDLLERLTAKFPKVLFEGCASGGGRFDAGMLYYTPQIWCSDDSEPSNRTFIQYATSFSYPMSMISAHVSPSPNHQTGRVTPLKTRGVVAMTGSFGYELNIALLSEEEKEEIREQVDYYKKNQDIFQFGKYYRLTNPYESNVVSWQYVSQSGDKSIMAVEWQRFPIAPHPFCVKLKGLEKNAKYKVTVDTTKPFVVETKLDDERRGNFVKNRIVGKEFSGNVLMNVGLRFYYMKEDYTAFFIEIEKI